jgi:hypothetical protein
MTPGKGNKPFKLIFQEEWMRKGDIIKCKNSYFPHIVILKVYKNNWWRKTLHFFGFKTKLLKGQFEVKVRDI